MNTIKSFFSFFFPKPKKNDFLIKNIENIKVIEGKTISRDVEELRNSEEFKKMSKKMSLLIVN